MPTEPAEIIDSSYPDAAIATITPHDGGGTHNVFRIKFGNRDPVVLKYSDEGQERLRRDTAALRYVAKETTVPIPEVLDFGSDPTYLVLESVSGERTPQLRDFEPAAATAYIETAGRLLGELHSDATFESVGRLHGTARGELRLEPARDWPALYEELKQATASELAGTRFEESAVAAMDALPGAVNCFTVEQSVLAHCDFGPNNVFRDEETVRGVIDWEWCLAADPAYDLTRAERLFQREADDGTRDALLRGYGGVRPVPEEYEDRVRLYNAYETLSAMSSFDSWRPDDSEKAAEIATRLQEDLAAGYR
jgi:Ser/Thr protein kinase RdoA (MazF antagonist)